MKKVFKRFMKKSVGIMIVMLMLVTTFMSPITVFARTRTINTVEPSGALNMSIDSSGILRWDAVPGATGYTVSLSRPNMTELNHWDTTNTHYVIINQIDQLKYDSGQYTIKVSAKGVHAEQTIAYYYYTSSVDQMEAPTNLRWNGNTAEWDAVPGASVYYIELNNFNGRVVFTSTSNTHQDFSSFSPEDGWTFRVSARPSASGTLSAPRNSLYIESPSYEGGTVLTHDVTFELDGGTMSGTNPVEVNDGEKVTKPVTDPAKEGYTFAGWYADAGLTHEFDFNNTTITADTTVYAKWEATSFTITYDANGGTGTMASISLVPTDGFVKTYVFPSCAFTAPTGKEFDHWEWAYVSDLTNIKNAEPGYSPWLSDSIIVSAIWKNKDYFNVTYDANGGTGTMPTLNLAPDTSGIVKTYVVPSCDFTAPAGKEFDHWEVAFESNPTVFSKLDIGGNPWLSESIVVKAIWKDITIVTYNVTFDLNGGTMSGANPVVVNDGEKVTKPVTDPAKEGYTFEGWYADAGLTHEFDFNNTTIEADGTIIYAKWNEIITSASATVTAPVGGQHPDFSPVVPSGANYTIMVDNWYLHEEPYPDLTNESIFETGKEYSLRVHFVPNEGYAFTNDTTFTMNGESIGKYGSTGDREYSKVATAPAVTTHQVTFNLNGGTMTGTNPVTVDDGAKVTRPTTDPIKAGYTFDGWYSDAGLTQEFDFDNTTIEADDTVIYAKWNTAPVVTTHNVTFDLNGGTPKGGLESVTANKTVDDGEEMNLDSTISLVVNAPEGKVLDSLEINGTRYELDGSTYTIHSDINIKFLWKDAYKIILNLNGGTPDDVSMKLEEVILPIVTITNPLVITLNDSNLGKVNAPDGKEFSHYEIDGIEYAIGDEYTINNTKNVTIKWIWKNTSSSTLTIEGDNQTFTLGDTKDIVITCSGALGELTAIKVNDVELDSANRELASGSTVLTLKNAYLNTLSKGTYKITFEYGAKSKDATLNVVEATNNDDNNNNTNTNDNNNNTNTNDNTNNNTNNNTSNNPQTSYNVVDYVYTLIIGIICLAGGTVYLKRKKLFGNR